MSTSFAEVKDGLSNTCMAAEATQLGHTSTSYGPYWGAGTHTSTHGVVYLTSPDSLPSGQYAGSRSRISRTPGASPAITPAG